MPRSLLIALSLLVSAVLAAVALALIPVLGWWVQCLAGKAPVSLLSLAAARMRRLPVHDIVVARLVAKRGGMDVPFERFARLSRRGGNPVRAATMLVTMQVAEFPADTEHILRLEDEGLLAGYIQAWEEAASQGLLPPDLPDLPESASDSPTDRGPGDGGAV